METLARNGLVFSKSGLRVSATLSVKIQAIDADIG